MCNIFITTKGIKQLLVDLIAYLLVLGVINN